VSCDGGHELQAGCVLDVCELEACFLMQCLETHEYMTSSVMTCCTCMLGRLLAACVLLAVGSMPSWYVLKMASEIEASTLASTCELRIDKCTCFAQSVPYATLLNAVG
jgi:hypothetical protein